MTQCAAERPLSSGCPCPVRSAADGAKPCLGEITRHGWAPRGGAAVVQGAVSGGVEAAVTNLGVPLSSPGVRHYAERRITDRSGLGRDRGDRRHKFMLRI